MLKYQESMFYIFFIVMLTTVSILTTTTEGFSSTASKLCKNLEVYSPFGIKDLDASISLESLKEMVKFESGTKKFRLLPPSENHQIRIEACLHSTTSEVRIAGITVQNGGSQHTFSASASTTLSTAGVQEAFFSTDKSKLKILAENRAGYGYLVQGYQAFVFASFLFKNGANQWDPNGKDSERISDVLVGHLTSGDLFSSECENGQIQTYLIEFEKVDLRGKYCGFQGGGLTTGWNLLSLTITDSSPAIATEFRGKAFSIDVLQSLEEKTLVTKYVHHNDSDKLNLSLPQIQAKYSLVMSFTGHATHVTIQRPNQASVQLKLKGHALLSR